LKNISRIFPLLAVFASVSAFATIEHDTCRLYLPVNNVITGWGEFREKLIKKGFEIVEVPATDVPTLPVNTLFTSLHYHYNRVGLKNTCSFQLTLSRIVQQEPFQSVMIFDEKRVTNRFSLSKTVNCNPAGEHVFAAFPKCVKK
jgi:hypothetical protein